MIFCARYALNNRGAADQDEWPRRLFRCQPNTLEENDSGSRVEELIGCDKTPCFSILRTMVLGNLDKPVTNGFIGIVTEGEGIVCIDGNDTHLKLWDRFFCPAGVDMLTYHSERGMTVVECYAGK